MIAIPSYCATLSLSLVLTLVARLALAGDIVVNFNDLSYPNPAVRPRSMAGPAGYRQL